MQRIVRRTSPARRGLATALVGFAAVLLVAAMATTWADRLLLSPGRWETTSTDLLANPTIRTSAATYLADQVLARLQPSQVSASDLGAALGPLSGKSPAAARTAIFQAMDTALGLPSVQALWAQANRGAATAVLAIVNGGRGPEALGDGALTVNLRPIIQAAATDAHLPAGLIAALPPDAGTLTVVGSNQLHTVQVAGRTVRDLARGLLIVVPLLWLVALALARGRRRRTLAAIGITTAVSAALVIGARALLVTPVADAISADPSLQRLIAAVITTITASLSQLAVVIVIIGLVFGLISGLAGLTSGHPRRLNARPSPR